MFAESINGVRTEKFQESLKFNFENENVNQFNKNNCSTNKNAVINNKIVGKESVVEEKKNLHSKCSFKNNGIIKAYAAITDKGIVRKYNEDRVSIILNVIKPKSRENENWPKCSFFAIYDGHGGSVCADFLRDHLHQYIINQNCFPYNPKEAIQKAFYLAEKDFLDFAKNGKNQIERSGSCGIVIIIIGEYCYVANVGDSRAILSKEKGKKLYALSRDHKPNEEKEKQRILSAGGKIYQTNCTSRRKKDLENNSHIDLFLGPFRAYPGKLSVSRTFGDIEAKLEDLGGNPNVIISEPEIKSFKITEDDDFIIFGSDGIFDSLSSREVIENAWKLIEKNKDKNIHNLCGLTVENTVEKALEKKSLDNVTAVMICFRSLINNENILMESKKNKENLLKQEKEDKLIRKYLYKKLKENITKPITTPIESSLIKKNENEKQKENIFANKIQKYNLMSSRLYVSKIKKNNENQAKISILDTHNIRKNHLNTSEFFKKYLNNSKEINNSVFPRKSSNSFVNKKPN